jgi:hypothetical protein
LTLTSARKLSAKDRTVCLGGLVQRRCNAGNLSVKLSVALSRSSARQIGAGGRASMQAIADWLEKLGMSEYVQCGHRRTPP